MAAPAQYAHRLCLFLLLSSAAGLHTRGSTSGPPQHLPEFDFGLSAHWDFSGANLTQNNLGGLGPKDVTGQHGMIMSRFARRGDTILDLRVTCTNPYVPNRVTSNKLRGPFAQINVDKDQTANLKFDLVESGTNTPVVLKTFVLTIWDLDHGNDGSGVEYVSVGPISRYGVSNPTTVDITQSNDSKFFTFKATTFGKKDDNPSDPYVLTDYQGQHAVTVEFAEISSFLLNFQVADGGSGRNLLLSGDSALLPETDMPTAAPTPVPPTPGPTLFPTPGPTSAPTPGPTPAPTPRPTQVPTRKPCGWCWR